MATFLEAVRRDRPDVVYGCLSESLCKERGLDGMVMAAAWDRLREQTPGLHLLGFATVPLQAVQKGAGICVYEIQAEDTRLTFELVRENYWELRYAGTDGRVRESSTRLDEASYQALVLAEPAAPDPIDDLPQTRVGLAQRTTVHPGVHALSQSGVEGLGLGREWKIAAIAVAPK